MKVDGPFWAILFPYFAKSSILLLLQQLLVSLLRGVSCVLSLSCFGTARDDWPNDVKTARSG